MYDIIHSIYLTWFGGYQSSFIGKRELTNYPLLGKLVTPLESVLIGRDKKDSNDQIDQVMTMIQERQLKAEKGEARPLTIFPEGCSTSGEYVIMFKKGAFASLRAVKPHSCKTWSPSKINPNSTGCLGFFQQLTLTICCGFYTYEQQEMPVFEPNQYFWDNHWDGKEPKWRLYARVVQKLIAD